MLKQGIIRPSDSPWSSPIWIVPKKLDASGQRKWRIVIDYRKLNEQTVEDRYPLPNINDILDKLGRSQYFSTIDLASGFHQIEVDPNDVQKTAFTVENGHYEFVRMPFGLKNAPSTFQRVMDNVLRGILNRLQTLEFVPEINQYLGIFPVSVPIKSSCSNVLAQHQIQGVFLFENQLNCQKYVNDQLLIFNDTTERKPIILEDFRLPVRNNVKIPKLTLRTLQVTSLTNNLPRLQMYPYEDSKNIWHLTGTAILYFVFLALAIWFMMQKIAFRRRNQTEEAPEPVELPRDAKF
ncbi:Retrovirus-related Pol polyprotein from transposon 17.6-like Protein [Tribolium castaneum]|uniref:Retrovirus-related Pol polyprotein from transposon 17.6-like Protein n=1 Tax=Tribolium castaneum TaxID=7070 RepID=A0A139WB22_TRICA|nr:Retrovirus-related Pol polyprotein from transposon 17.6-like Protein [Tribolium castaneum]